MNESQLLLAFCFHVSCLNLLSHKFLFVGGYIRYGRCSFQCQGSNPVFPFTMQIVSKEIIKTAGLCFSERNVGIIHKPGTEHLGICLDYCTVCVLADERLKTNRSDETSHRAVYVTGCSACSQAHSCSK